MLGAQLVLGRCAAVAIPDCVVDCFINRNGCDLSWKSDRLWRTFKGRTIFNKVLVVHSRIVTPTPVSLTVKVAELLERVGRDVTVVCLALPDAVFDACRLKCGLESDSP